MDGPILVEARTATLKDQVHSIFWEALEGHPGEYPPIPESQYWHDKLVGFLWLVDKETPSTAIGAVTFEWEENEADAALCWELTGVWLQPAFRRKGVLSRSWPVFLERFGKFHVSEPNDDMQRFLRRIKHPGTPK